MAPVCMSKNIQIPAGGMAPAPGQMLFNSTAPFFQPESFPFPGAADSYNQPVDFFPVHARTMSYKKALNTASRQFYAAFAGVPDDSNKIVVDLNQPDLEIGGFVFTRAKFATQAKLDSKVSWLNSRHAESGLEVDYFDIGETTVVLYLRPQTLTSESVEAELGTT